MIPNIRHPEKGEIRQLEKGERMRWGPGDFQCNKVKWVG